VSWEHVVSGPALVWIYEFFRDTGRAEEPPALRASLDAAKEPAVVITQSALAERVSRSASARSSSSSAATVPRPPTWRSRATHSAAYI
jgi:glucokinase